MKKEKILEMAKKYKETILYLIFGVLSTVVNIVTYVFFSMVVGLNYLVANLIAWIIAVFFAYITNKFWVFGSKEIKFNYLLKEISSFVGCRLFSGGIEMLIMFVMISVLNINDFVVKIITNVIVVILNYIFSKLLIFRNNI
ncbi:MAG: GtrA family protein [Clostridium sp.]|uniref:GtrA family protein n=1 Tax=Clostridium sp. TaxID=1506 RepID=UPI00290D9646|nr:GtrA family protein [Clostridium sp.]MDU3411328.1 GtrA family protein [Clostridium sp.]MDU4789064.1 GtrA family protein [Clostridium sp.]MDU6807971.1 GtrA family protein [Clostridium sp.]